MINFIKNNWVLLLILIVAIYLVYKYYQKNKDYTNTSSLATSVTNVVKDVTGQVKSNTGDVVVNQPVPSVVNVPVNNTDSSKWKVGDKMFAGSTGVNLYSSPTATSSNIIKFYNKDNYIGTFLAIQNGYAKIITQEKTDSLVSFMTGVPTYSAQVRYALLNQIYSK